ncbi:MAG: LysR family transcriptional regulator [Cellulosilyticaceae bacterium]
MYLHHLELFNTVACSSSLTKASEVLHISQPALSIQIKKLEESLDLKLFDKIGNKLVLNQNGKTLLHYTQQIFSLLDEAQEKLSTHREHFAGEITLGGSNTPGTYILPQILGNFKCDYPNVALNLHIATTDEITQLVSNGIIDFAINGGDVIYPSHIASRKLFEDELILSCSPQRLLTLGSSHICISQLKNIPFIAHQPHSQLSKIVSDFISECQLSSQIVMSLGNIDAIKQAVAADLGISLIPRTALTLELKSGLIKQLTLDNKHWTYPYHLIQHKHKYLSPASLKLQEHIYQVLQP